ncbi:MAG: hypothetical protein ACE5KC_03025 [Candidatus Bathyarchaeia archaeon]
MREVIAENAEMFKKALTLVTMPEHVEVLGLEEEWEEEEGWEEEEEW